MTWAFYVRSVPFTKAVIAGTASLGGSESACVGLARALQARGHDVTIFAHDLAADAEGEDHAGVCWLPAAQLQTLYQHWMWDVFVSLRMSEAWIHPPLARYRIQWNQDLLQNVGTAKLVEQMFSLTWPVDTIAYVSQYHRTQWEGVEPHLAPLGWVTRNGYDPTLVPTDTTRDWRRVLHISRPERGLGPLLEMWPAIRAAEPEAELRICRYSSMYDKEGWGQICAQYDAAVAAVQAQVGGITWLGELGKAALYRELSESAVMAYPGVSDFAETSCIAAIEAQACGLPFVGSLRGALLETVPGGVLVPGRAEDAEDTAYRETFVREVVRHLHGCRDGAPWYADVQTAGRQHVDPAYTYAALAADWEARAHAQYQARWEAQPLGIMRRLLHEDDHMAALAALDRLDAEGRPWTPEEAQELADARTRCLRVIAGEDHTADSYAATAVFDAVVESHDPRFELAAKLLDSSARVLDVACGQGSGAIRFALEHPTRQVVGIDYSPDLVARATAAAARAGVGDRVRFEVVPVYDYATHQMTEACQAWVAAHLGQFDGLFVGEFLEHVANVRAVLDGLEPALMTGAYVVATMPHGPFGELLVRGTPCYRGHVHHFEIDDLHRVFGAKAGTAYHTLATGLSPRGVLVGHWVVRYVMLPGRPTGDRDYGWRAWTCRPQQRLSVGILANEDAHDLRRCLDSVYGIADEIILGDTSPGPPSAWVAECAAAFGARVLPVAPPTDHERQPDGFAGARNQVLDACVGEWFLWIDTDETLEGSMYLPPYLVTGPFVGYALRQNHLMLDSPRNYDVPVRVFRRVPQIRFYGCVHEQPQWLDANGDIQPGLELLETAIMHVGYRTEGLRRKKSGRNLPLLNRNHEQFPERTLNYVLDLRECVLRAGDALADHDEDLAKLLLGKAVRLFETHCSDPASKYHALGRPWYDQALANMPAAWQFEIAAAGTQGSLNGRQAKADRLRFRRAEDFQRWWAWKGEQLTQGLISHPVDTRPVAIRADEEAPA